MKIIKLDVNYFRHIEGMTINFGDKLTAICGQNGTGKSSLLGWLAQACIDREKNKTLTGKKFKTPYSQVFRFCKINDYQNKYSLSLVYKEKGKAKDGSISEQEKTKNMTTRLIHRINKKDRYKVDYDGRLNAIQLPVIYLGLKRLIPLATEKKISPKEIELSKQEKIEFAKLASQILIMTSDEKMSDVNYLCESTDN